MARQNYVVGYMFSHCGNMVALIRKNRPRWQEGKLNGIGGKVERGENHYQAQVREFWEETGKKTKPHDWKWFLQIQGPEYNVDCFTGRGDLMRLRDITDEKIEIHLVSRIAGRKDTVPNLPWLISMALCVPVVRHEYTVTSNKSQRRTR